MAKWKTHFFMIYAKGKRIKYLIELKAIDPHGIKGSMFFFFLYILCYIINKYSSAQKNKMSFYFELLNGIGGRKETSICNA